MTNKERQAKLQYLLNSLSMTKEQKDIVVDLVNSSGNGGGGGKEDNEPLVIKIYTRQTVNLETIYVVECDGEIHDNNSNPTMNIISENIYNKIDKCVNNNINIIISYIMGENTMEFINGTFIIKMIITDDTKGYRLNIAIDDTFHFDIIILTKEISTE